MRIALVNPNNSAATTEAMLRIARPRPPEAEMVGLTALFGAALITDGAGLAEAARAEAAEALRRRLPVPLVAPIPAAIHLTLARLIPARLSAARLGGAA